MSNPPRKASSSGFQDSSPSSAVSPPASQSKRERIIDAALRLFANQPYQAVTMDKVAEAAGVAKGTLYLYFQSKEDLYLGILTDGMEAATRAYQSTVDPSLDVRVRLRRAITSTIEFYERRPDLLRLLMTEEPRMAEARNRLREEMRDRGLRFFNSLIDEGVEKGIFHVADARLATHAILGSVRSVMLFYGDKRPVEKLGGELAEMFVRGLGADPASNHRKASHA